MRPRTTPRFIEPASVEIGDYIRVSWSAQGIDHTRTAVVYRRIDDGELRGFFTQEGTEIMSWVPGGKNARVTLLNRPQKLDTMQALFDLEHIA